MLYLNRKPGEAVIINHAIEVRVVEECGKTVTHGFSCPPGASVLRAELFDAIKQANEAALVPAHPMPTDAHQAAGSGPAVSK